MKSLQIYRSTIESPQPNIDRTYFRLIAILLAFLFISTPFSSILASKTSPVSATTLITTYPSKYYNIDSNGKVVKHIFANGIEIATVTGTGASAVTEYVQTDNLGSTNVVSDETGAIVETADYYPFGSIRLDQKTTSFSEQRKYIGQEYDTETKLNYLNARYYDSNTGKFLSQDPVFWEVGQTKDGKNALSNPQAMNSPRTMDGLNSASAFGWRKNTQSRAGSMSGWSEFLADPKMQNSYSYGRNNPITMSDPKGEFAVNLNFTTNAGLGGATGNTWSVGFASDGSYGVSTSLHGGGFAGYDASIGGSVGYSSSANSWNDIGGKSNYVGGGVGLPFAGVDGSVNFSPNGKYNGGSIGIGIGPSSPIYMNGGAEKTTVVVNRNIKQDVQNIARGLGNAVNSVASAVGQGVKNLVNKLIR